MLKQGLLLSVPIVCGLLIGTLVSAESFLDTECLHKAPAGIALQNHIAQARSGNVQSMFCAGAINLYVSRD